MVMNFAIVNFMALVQGHKFSMKYRFVLYTAHEKPFSRPFPWSGRLSGHSIDLAGKCPGPPLSEFSASTLEEPHTARGLRTVSTMY